jgi:hypothetical protein
MKILPLENPKWLLVAILKKKITTYFLHVSGSLDQKIFVRKFWLKFCKNWSMG